MGRPDVAAAWRAVSPRHRRTNLRGDRVEVLALLLRLVAVGLLGARSRGSTCTCGRRAIVTFQPSDRCFWLLP